MSQVRHHRAFLCSLLVYGVLMQSYDGRNIIYKIVVILRLEALPAGESENNGIDLSEKKL